MKRIDNVAKSPLFIHVYSTLDGLHTVHAYNKERDFITKSVF